MVLMALAAALAIPFLRGSLDSLASASAGRRLVAFLNDARLRSMNTAVPVEVAYDPEQRAFSQRLGGKEKARLELPRGVRVTAMEVPGEQGEQGEKGTPPLTFYPLGDSSGGFIVLEDEVKRRFKVTVGVLFATPVLAAVTE